MNKAATVLIQTLFYSLIGLGVVYFSNSPSYQYFAEDQALIKLSFKHTGQRLEECKRLTSEEIAKLPPNKRKPMDCSRERSPLLVEIILDGVTVYQETLLPSGLFSDGPAKIYFSQPVMVGPHQISVRMRDTGRTEGFDFEHSGTFELTSLEILVIDFSPEAGGFVFK